MPPTPWQRFHRGFSVLLPESSAMFFSTECFRSPLPPTHTPPPNTHTPPLLPLSSSHHRIPLSATHPPTHPPIPPPTHTSINMGAVAFLMNLCRGRACWHVWSVQVVTATLISNFDTVVLKIWPLPQKGLKSVLVLADTLNLQCLQLINYPDLHSVALPSPHSPCVSGLLHLDQPHC